MQFKLLAVFAGGMFLAGGCATQDQLRQTEADSTQQRQAMAALRTDVRRTESAITELRASVDRKDASIRQLEAALAETSARAEKAHAVSTEFLASLLAVREEQRRQLDENGRAFADARRRLTDLDSRLQAQQRRLEQGSAAFEDSTRRLIAVEAALVAIGRKSTELETTTQGLQETDEALARQLAELRTQAEQLRAAVGSESFLRMMRELEGARRDTASLRGAFEELQKSQADAAARFRNYYVDLDTRMRTVKQKVDEQMTRDLKAVGEDSAALRAQLDELKQAQAQAEARFRSDHGALEARIESLSRGIEARQLATPVPAANSSSERVRE